MQKEKGAVDNLLTWALAAFASVSLAFTGTAVSKNNDQDRTLIDHQSQISEMKGTVNRMPYLEGKLDRILEAQKINPEDVEREVERQLNLQNATTVPTTSNQALR